MITDPGRFSETAPTPTPATPQPAPLSPTGRIRDRATTRLRIDHQTHYRFSEPQAQVVQLLRVTPVDTASQTVLDWQVDVDCDARLSTGLDGYGNRMTMVYLVKPTDHLTIAVRGTVLTETVEGRICGVNERFPPVFYTRTTARTLPGPLVTARGLALLDDGQTGSDAPLPARTRAERITSAVGDLIAIHGARGQRGRTPDEVLNSGFGSGRDAAHLLIALAHVADLPARMVAGHARSPQGGDTEHSARYWTELYLGEEGWVAFDPRTGARARRGYLRVAIGLDEADTTPVSGIRRGGGVEQLNVAVRVDARDHKIVKPQPEAQIPQGAAP